MSMTNCARSDFVSLPHSPPLKLLKIILNNHRAGGEVNAFNLQDSLAAKTPCPKIHLSTQAMNNKKKPAYMPKSYLFL